MTKGQWLKQLNQEGAELGKQEEQPDPTYWLLWRCEEEPINYRDSDGNRSFSYLISSPYFLVYRMRRE